MVNTGSTPNYVLNLKMVLKRMISLYSIDCKNLLFNLANEICSWVVLDPVTSTSIK